MFLKKKKTNEGESTLPRMTFVLLIGHGSRFPFNKEMVDMHAGLLRDKGYRVYTAFNETNEPTIEDAMGAMIKDKAEEIVALPIFISSGVHTEKDIPLKLGIPGYGAHVSTKYGRKVVIRYREPFGDDPGVTQVLLKKLKAIGCDDDTGVLLISHGSPMSHSSALVSRMSGRLKISGIKNVFIGFNEYNEPTIEDSYAEMIGAGFGRIIVLPMFLASGTHIGEEIPEKLGIPAGCSSGQVKKGDRTVSVLYAETLGLNPEMNEILVKKIKTSWV